MTVLNVSWYKRLWTKEHKWQALLKCGLLRERKGREVGGKGGREESGRSKQEGRSDSDQNTVYTIY